MGKILKTSLEKDKVKGENHKKKKSLHDIVSMRLYGGEVKLTEIQPMWRRNFSGKSDHSSAIIT